MIWYFAKKDHLLAIRPWVRAWLRAGGLTRFVIVLIINAAASAIMAPLTLTLYLISPRGSNVAGLFSFVLICIWIFWIVDTFLEKWSTRRDIERMLSSPDIALATRGEYIGGHPMLPHGRFVYLALGGTLEQPLLSIILPEPRAYDERDATEEGEETGLEEGEVIEEGAVEEESEDPWYLFFSMPVVDIEKTEERIGEAEEEITAAVMVADVTLETKFIGPRAILRVQYIGQHGRRHQVEFGHFFGGDGEVQNWRNYIVCIQAQAETGQQPYGPWKTLPAEKQVANAGVAVVN